MRLSLLGVRGSTPAPGPDFVRYGGHTSCVAVTPRGQDVRALVMLSPDSVAGRLQTTRAMNYLRNPQFGIALLVIAGKKDTQDKGTSKKLYDLFKGRVESGAERVYISDPDLKNRGTDLLLKAPNLVEGPIVKFLVKHVKDVVVPWRDRRSKLEL